MWKQEREKKKQSAHTLRFTKKWQSKKKGGSGYKAAERDVFASVYTYSAPIGRLSWVTRWTRINNSKTTTTAKKKKKQRRL
jgi:hypothetical protein